MKKYALIAVVIVLGMGVFQPAMAQNGFLGGGVFTTDAGVMPAVRFGAGETFFFDFGLMFSTVAANNYTVAFGVANRVAEIEDVSIHVGGSLGITEVAGNTAFGFGVLIGAEAFLNDNFSVTANAIPLQIQANGDTEALFLRGSIGVMVYI